MVSADSYELLTAQVFRNTPDDNTLFLAWAAVGFILYAVGAGMSLLLQNIPNRFRPAERFNRKNPGWRHQLRLLRQLPLGVGAIIGGLGIVSAIGEASGDIPGTYSMQVNVPLIVVGLLILLGTGLSSLFTALD